MICLKFFERVKALFQWKSVTEALELFAKKVGHPSLEMSQAGSQGRANDCTLSMQTCLDNPALHCWAGDGPTQVIPWSSTCHKFKSLISQISPKSCLSCSICISCSRHFV